MCIIIVGRLHASPACLGESEMSVSLYPFQAANCNGAPHSVFLFDEVIQALSLFECDRELQKNGVPYLFVLWLNRSWLLGQKGRGALRDHLPRVF